MVDKIKKGFKQQKTNLKRHLDQKTCKALKQRDLQSEKEILDESEKDFDEYEQNERNEHSDQALLNGSQSSESREIKCESNVNPFGAENQLSFQLYNESEISEKTQINNFEDSDCPKSNFGIFFGNRAPIEKRNTLNDGDSNKRCNMGNKKRNTLDIERKMETPSEPDENGKESGPVARR